MPVCKFCNKPITYLREFCSGTQKCNIFFNEREGYVDWEKDSMEFEGDGDFLEYLCPECLRCIASDYEEAEKFLTEKDELKRMITKKIEMGSESD